MKYKKWSCKMVSPTGFFPPQLMWQNKKLSLHAGTIYLPSLFLFAVTHRTQRTLYWIAFVVYFFFFFIFNTTKPSLYYCYCVQKGSKACNAINASTKALVLRSYSAAYSYFAQLVFIFHLISSPARYLFLFVFTYISSSCSVFIVIPVRLLWICK